MEGEFHRRSFREEELDLLRKRVIGKHRVCKGTGYVEELVKEEGSLFARKIVEQCRCRKKFDLASRFLISEIPYRVLVNQQIYGKMVVDVTAGNKIELRREVIKPYIKSLRKALSTPFGFLFLGKNGTGKTFVGLKILYYSIITGFTAHNIDMADYLKLTRAAFEKYSDIEKRINEIQNVDILLIDELGNESRSSTYVISEFKSLFKKRITARKPTIIISNYSYEEFKRVYGRSVNNIVSSHCRVFDFSEAADVRKTKCSNEMDLFFKKLKK